MPTQRGLLGVAKDPKRPMLFTYSGEAWPSDDDSEDSDYELPEDKELPKKVLKNSAVKRKSRKQLKKDDTTSAASCSSSEKHSRLESAADVDYWGSLIPGEVLFRIFEFVVAEEALPFLVRASRVCQLWYETSLRPSLWMKVDLSYGWIKSTDQTLEWLSKNRLSRCRDISVSTWKNLTSLGLKAVAEHCPFLRTINLSNCKKLKAESLQYLIDRCDHLESLDLSYSGNDTVSQQSLKYLIEKRGSKLKSLNLTGCLLKGFNGVINAIAANCLNLECLDVSNATFSSDFMSLNIERFQTGCPRLRFLRLAGSKFRATTASARQQAESPGFPALEELSVAIPDGGFVDMGLGMDDEFIHRLLKSSPKLRLIDLRGSTHITASVLQSLPCSHLQHLFISQSSMAKYDGIEIIMQKWQHSLRELDLSWNIYPGMSLDLAMHKLSNDPSRSRLESLNLSGTCISSSRLKSLLEGCPNLQTLNLCSCRGLPRGMKRVYEGDSLQELRAGIDDIVQEHEGLQINEVDGRPGFPLAKYHNPEQD